MKTPHDPRLSQWRIKTGQFASPDNFGNTGEFRVPAGGMKLVMVVATDGKSELGDNGWEHVSVSLPDRCPTWDEMCFIKDVFWRDDETVIQFHPMKSNHVNNHRFCLHLWKPTHKRIELPPEWMVGIKGLGTIC